MERNDPREAVVVAYGRSAVTRGKKGALAKVHPIEFGGQVLAGTIKKIPQLDPLDIDDVIYGCTNLTGYQSYDVTKMIAARAGLPPETSAITVSRFCASGSDAIAMGAAKIRADMADVVVCGGVESMSLVPQPVPETRYDYHWLEENVDPNIYLHVGLCAENSAKACGLTREDLDQFSVMSHLRAAKAQDEGKFRDEIIPVVLKDENGKEYILTEDECIRRDTSLEELAKLKPVFDPNGLVTAGSSSQVSDGTGCVILMSREKADKLGIRPIARLVGFAPGCASPAFLTPGVLAAIEKVTKRTGMRLDQMEVFEFNEAFAPVVIELSRKLDISMDKINPNGGAIALGHPLGATGAILAIKLFSELKRIHGRYGMVAMCAAIGHGAAAIYEML